MKNTLLLTGIGLLTTTLSCPTMAVEKFHIDYEHDSPAIALTAAMAIEFAEALSEEKYRAYAETKYEPEQGLVYTAVAVEILSNEIIELIEFPTKHYDNNVITAFLAIHRLNTRVFYTLDGDATAHVPSAQLPGSTYVPIGVRLEQFDVEVVAAGNVGGFFEILVREHAREKAWGALGASITRLTKDNFLKVKAIAIDEDAMIDRKPLPLPEQLIVLESVLGSFLHVTHRLRVQLTLEATP